MKTIQLNTVLFLVLSTLITFTFQACDDDPVDDPPQMNEEELITTVEMTFTNADDAEDVRTFRFSDPDGEGGNAPETTDTIELNASSTYDLAIRFLDESDPNSVEDITEEVEEEADEHLVCYTTPGDLTVTITDKDANELNLGLAATVTTSEAENTSLLVQLKHQPDVKDGSCEPGDTDVEVLFQTVVK